MTTTNHRGLRIITGSARLPGDLKSCPRPAGEPAGENPGMLNLSVPQDSDPRPGASSPRVLKIVVPGRPRGKPRMTQRDKWKQRPCVMAYREWADQVRAAAGQMPPAESVLSLDWTANFTPPPSWPKTKQAAAIGTLHRVKPDASNILKGLEDVLWPENDSALASGSYEKRWAWDDSLEIRITVSP